MYVPEEDHHGKRSDLDVPNKTTHVLLSCKRLDLEDGQMSYFRMKRSAPLQKLMNAYRANYREEATSTSTVFMYGGRKINSENTPDELQMEDGDVIYAFPKFYCGCQKCKPKRWVKLSITCFGLSNRLKTAIFLAIIIILVSVGRVTTIPHFQTTD